MSQCTHTGGSVDIPQNTEKEAGHMTLIPNHCAAEGNESSVPETPQLMLVAAPAIAATEWNRVSKLLVGQG